MKVKVPEATPKQIDWMVAEADGDREVEVQDGECVWFEDDYKLWHPTTNWSQGGPIIEREKIDTFHQENGYSGAILMATSDNPHPTPYYGETTLIAAMRCYVVSKLGEEVEVPEELQ